MDLFLRFQQSVGNADMHLAAECFGATWKKYTEPGRHYHTFHHIQQLLRLADEFSGVIQKKAVVDLAIFYHDVVYEAGKNDNEIRSAEIAREALEKLGVLLPIIQDVCDYIIATKDHFTVNTDDTDLKYFLDFDLSILSASPEIYKQYAEQIRQEYASIPDAFYNAGRITFLNKALQLPELYFTDEFRKNESKAKSNLEWERNLLEGVN